MIGWRSFSATRNRPVTMFLAVALGFSTIMLIVARTAPEAVANSRVPITLAKFGPSIGGIFMLWWLRGGDGVRTLLRRTMRWRIHPRWYVFSLLGPFVLFGIAIVVASGELPTVSSERPAGDLVPGFLTILLMRVFLGGGLGEELGWRGFLVPTLTGRLGVVLGAGLTGVAAGLWHFPANGLASALALTTLTIPWSCILAWMYYGSGRSLVPCILAHGAGNAGASFVAVLFPGLGVAWMVWVVILSWVGAVLAIIALRRDALLTSAVPGSSQPQSMEGPE